MKKASALFMAVIMLLSTFTTAYAKPDNDMVKVETHLKEKYDIQNFSEEFTVVDKIEDEMGYRHILLQQMINGIPLYDGEYALHLDKNDNIYFENGKIDMKAKNQSRRLVRAASFISTKEAIEAAKEDINYQDSETVENNDKAVKLPNIENIDREKMAKPDMVINEEEASIEDSQKAPEETAKPDEEASVEDSQKAPEEAAKPDEEASVEDSQKAPEEAAKLDEEASVEDSQKTPEETAKLDQNIVEEDNVPDEIIESEMYIYNMDDNYIPVYLVRLCWTKPDSIHDWRVFVDARDGDVVDKYDAVSFGTGTGVLGDTKTFNTSLSGSNYYMIDNSRNIRTYDSKNRYTLPGTLMSDSDDQWVDSTQRAGVDAHYYAGIVYDYYKTKHGRNSIDNRGMQIVSSVRYGNRYNNAGWTGSQMMYGDGDGITFTALSGALDVVGHEITHGVTQYTCNLEYRNQSGALNESISDVMGTCIEAYGQPSKFNWLCGEDIYTPNIPGDALRSLEDPTLYNQPAHMKDYVNTTSDNGGVHINSGIPNKAAYLIGSAIGIDKLEKIVYRAMTVGYLTKTSQFTNYRAAILRATADLYGSNGTEYNTAVNAFNSVGIY